MLRVPLFLYTGLKNFTKEGYLKAARSFDQQYMVQESSLLGKTCMVTGANQGLGLQVSIELASRGGSLYMVCRNEAKGREAVERVKRVSKNDNVHLLICDISSLKDVEKLCNQYIQSGRPLHVLINNAGVLIHDGSKSVDGYEINFATNTLGTYALTCGLEPALKASAPSRVIMVSSGGALTAHLETVDLEGVKIKSKDGSDFYARDKRRQIALAEYFDEEWKNDGVRCCSMHPGWVETEGVKSSIPGFYNAFRSKLRNLEQGADTIVWLSVCPDVDIQGGEFYLDRKVASKHLFMAGTKYSSEDLQKLVRNLNRYREKKM